MINLIKYTLTMAFLALGIATANAQCQSDECVSKLSEGYIFLKSYSMEKSATEVEYSYVFSKDTDYMLVTCNKDGHSNNVIVTLYDSNKKVIATNYDPKAEKYYTAIAYNCKATGIYYLKYSFKETSECCVSVLAFKK
ncbi:MAG TPA: hypothetical protein VIK89_06805 [Cytophagaceae bacterium]